MKRTWTLIFTGISVLLSGCAGSSDPSTDDAPLPDGEPASRADPDDETEPTDQPGEGVFGSTDPGAGGMPDTGTGGTTNTGTGGTTPNTDAGGTPNTDAGGSEGEGTGGNENTGTGGAEETGTGPIVDPEEPEVSVCEEGISNGAESVCCPSSCGSCGGAGCSDRPGGTDSCCSGAIEANGEYCDEFSPPCIVGSTPDVIEPEPPVGDVLWYGDPNLPLTTVFYRFDTHGNANPTGNQCVDNPDTPPVASTPTDNSHGKHWRIFKPTSRKRAEFARTNGLVPQEGDDWYFGWRWRITSPGPIDSGMAVFQWKSQAGNDTWPDTQNYPFTMGYNGQDLTVTAHGPGYPDWTEGSSITNRATTIWRHAVQKGEWVTILFHVKVSRDPSIGFIEFWFNGQKQTLTNSNFKEYQVVLANDDTRAYHKTMDSTQVYMKWGAYGQGACNMDITVDFDEMRVATSYDLVAQPLAE